MSEWVRLKVGNDWGVNYFAIEPLNRHGTADSRRGIKVRSGDRVRVRWPDSHESEHEIRLGRTSVTINDMRHAYEVRSEEPYIVCSFHGEDVLVRIDKVEVPLDWAREKGAL